MDRRAELRRKAVARSRERRRLDNMLVEDVVDEFHSHPQGLYDQLRPAVDLKGPVVTITTAGSVDEPFITPTGRLARASEPAMTDRREQLLEDLDRGIEDDAGEGPCPNCDSYNCSYDPDEIVRR